MAATRLCVITPAATKFNGDAELVIAPGSAGDLGALVKHAPLLTTLRVGVVSVLVPGAGGGSASAAPASSEAAQDRIEFAIDGGLMEVMPNKVVVLADHALTRAELNVDDARAELRRAEEAFAKKTGADNAPERRAVDWARAKLQVLHVPAD